MKKVLIFASGLALGLAWPEIRKKIKEASKKDLGDTVQDAADGVVDAAENVAETVKDKVDEAING